MPARRYDGLERRKMELKRYGITQADLARSWKTSQPFVSRLLKGDGTLAAYGSHGEPVLEVRLAEAHCAPAVIAEVQRLARTLDAIHPLLTLAGHTT